MDPTPTSPTASDLIDLTEERARPSERVRLDGDLGPLARLSHEERVRLIVRVLCELVAYQPDESDGDTRLTA